MKDITDTMVSIIGARPVGSEANNQAVEFLREIAADMNYETTLIPFPCNRWEPMPSIAERGGVSTTLYPSPFSRPFNGMGEAVHIGTVAELKGLSTDLNDKILVLTGDIANDPLMPKNFPFYYPDEHKQVIDLLEEKRPLAIVSVTGKHPMCGLNPFPMFEDGNFNIP
jgi:aminopeptidase YwaD